MRRSGGVFRELQCEERVQKEKSQGLLWSVGLGGDLTHLTAQEKHGGPADLKTGSDP